MAVVSPAAAIDRRDAARGVRVLERLGYHVRIAPAAFRRSGYFAGSDDVRARSLEEALRDPEVRAVFFARGGYGTARLLPLLTKVFPTLEPKILVGYSDATALLDWVSDRYGWITFHGPMVSTDFPDLSSADARLLRDVLEGRSQPVYGLRSVTGGSAKGRLFGGNLSTLVSILGTPYAPRLDGTILFLEESNERPYRVDRMLTQLRLAGILERVSALVLGEMPGCGTAREIRRIVADVTAGLPVPIATGLRSGHGRGKQTLPIGALARLDDERPALEILEAVVR